MPVLKKKEEDKLIQYARALRRWRNSLDVWRDNLDEMLNEIGLEDEVLTVPRLARRGVPRTAKEAITPPSPPTRRALVTRKVGKTRKSA